MAGTEPFPPMPTSIDSLSSAPENGTVRRRRKSSALGKDIRAGDTGPSLEPIFEGLSSSRSSSKVSERSKTSKRKNGRSFLRRCMSFAVKHTWAVPLVLVIAFLLAYAVYPNESNIVHHFIFLSYKLPLDAGADPSTPPQYGKGRWDFAFVTFYSIVLTFTREFIMQELLRPMARTCGIRTRGKQLRFMEQMYTAIYFGIMGPVGFYVMYRSPVWYFNTPGMYENFPHRSHEAIFKFYYLFEAAYWAEQAVVMLLGVEKRRNDFKELVTHHIVTLALIGGSYRFHFTYMGIAIYLTHDVSDFFLAISKSLNYIDSPVIGPFFATSIAVWIYMRHYLNIRILLSIWNEFQTVGPFGIVWETQQYKGPLSQYLAFALLATLQSLNLFWLYCLLRSAYKFVVLNIAKDDRSEDEESELEDFELEEAEAANIEGKALLNGNGSANGAAKATGNGAATQSTKKRTAQ